MQTRTTRSNKMNDSTISRLSAGLALVFLLTATSGVTRAALTDNTWQGAANDSFSTGSNWSEASAPVDSDRAVIDSSSSGGTPVILDSSTTIGGLSLASGDTLQRADGDTSDYNFTLWANDPDTGDRVTELNNAGTFSTGGTSGHVNLRFVSDGNTPFSNSGVIEVTAGSELTFRRGRSVQELTNTGGTIRTVGSGTLNLGNSNNFPISGGSLSNPSGTLIYGGKAELELTDVTFTNGGTADFSENSSNNSRGFGLILSGDSSFTNTGTFNLTRDPALNSNSNPAAAVIRSSVDKTSITNSGTINISATTDNEDSENKGFAGFDLRSDEQTLTNDGTINLESKSSTHDTVFNAQVSSGNGVTLDGTGEIVMKVGVGGTVSRVLMTGSNGVITQNAGHTVRGAGSIGGDSLAAFNNSGTVVADDPTYALTLDPSSGGEFVNNNTVQASGAGGLVLAAGKHINNDTIQIDPGSSLTLKPDAEITNSDGQIEVTIADTAPLGTWSIAWEGDDFRSTLDGWVDDGRLSYTFDGSGTIGSWFDEGPNTTFFGVVVPEPASAMTILVGLGCIALRRRRR